MAAYRRSSRTRNVLAVLVLAALTLITIDARSNGSGFIGEVRSKVSDAFSPLQRATHDVLRPIGNFLSGAANYGNLKAENERLRQQLAQAQNQAAAAQAERNEYDQVLGQLGLPFEAGIPAVSAQIIDVGASNFDNTIVVNKGKANGIFQGQPVVAALGLVGTVEAASSHTATIELLTDPGFKAGVTLPGSNTGYLAGEGRNQPLQVTVVVNSKLPAPVTKVGDPLYTSGLSDEKFPAGIPVGKVAKVDMPAGSAEPLIELSPAVNTSQLSVVQILLWSPQSPAGPSPAK